jgi:hypothetical protein
MFRYESVIWRVLVSIPNVATIFKIKKQNVTIKIDKHYFPVAYISVIIIIMETLLPKYQQTSTLYSLDIIWRICTVAVL